MVPNTNSEPPLEINAPAADPPLSICRMPPAAMTVALAKPPDRTSRVLPAPDTTSPELVTPDDTNWVPMDYSYHFRRDIFESVPVERLGRKRTYKSQPLQYSSAISK